MTKKPTPRARSEQERLLDEALEETFPASDPTSTQQAVTVGRADRPLSQDAPAKKAEKKRSRAA